MMIKLMLVSWFKCAEDSIKCKFFTVNTTDFAFVYEKKILSTSIFRQLC